jgi:hypothetical protein
MDDMKDSLSIIGRVSITFSPDDFLFKENKESFEFVLRKKIIDKMGLHDHRFSNPMVIGIDCSKDGYHEDSNIMSWWVEPEHRMGGN